MKKLLIITCCLFLLPAVMLAQKPGNVNTMLVGKWLLVKHTYTEKGKTEDLLTSNETYVYDFSGDGSYEVSYSSKKTESTTVYKGKWKIVSNGKKLKLFDNNILPLDSTTLVNDRLLPIIRITPGEFVTKELLFGMDLLGKSYYKKQ